MNKFIITFFIIWIVWKVLKSAFEELQRRMEDLSAKQGPETLRPPSGETIKPQEASRKTVSPPGRTTISREPDEWELGKPIPGEEESELEKWFSEAIERKRQLDDADEAIPLTVTERESVEPARPPAPQPQQVRRRVEPSAEQRREVRVVRRRVVHPRKRVAVEPPKDAWKPPLAPKKPKKAGKARRPVARERPAPGQIVCAGNWDMNRIRRGIILAEILGTPKALRDIDSHVV